MSARARHRWSLQTRLIATVVGMVALILAMIGVATATTLRAIISDSLDSEIKATASSIHLSPGSTAQDALNKGRQQNGTLLILQTFGTLTGAYVDNDSSVVAMTDEEIASIVANVPQAGLTTLDLPSLGDYRVYATSLGGNGFAILGLSLIHI